jgi:hypothetical protein
MNVAGQTQCGGERSSISQARRERKSRTSGSPAEVFTMTTASLRCSGSQPPELQNPELTNPKVLCVWACTQQRWNGGRDFLTLSWTGTQDECPEIVATGEERRYGAEEEGTRNPIAIAAETPSSSELRNPTKEKGSHQRTRHNSSFVRPTGPKWTSTHQCTSCGWNRFGRFGMNPIHLTQTT